VGNYQDPILNKVVYICENMHEMCALPQETKKPD